MTRYPCSGCGETSCGGECYLADDPEAVEWPPAWLKAWNERNPDVVAEIRARVLGLPAPDKLGDPLLRKVA